MRPSILELLRSGEPVVGDGGMLYALERRGYVKAGSWTPECTVEHPEAGMISHSFWVANDNSKTTAKRGHINCGGYIVSCDVAHPRQNAATLLQTVWTQKVFLKIFRNIFCVRHKCCVRGKMSQHLGNMITSAMLPPQCVLVLPAL